MKAHSSASCRQTPRWALLPGGGCGGSQTPGRRLGAEHGQRVCMASHRAQPPVRAHASPVAPGHAHHRGRERTTALGTAGEQRPQATSAWDKKASGVPRAPCLHSCRCEDRHQAGGHSPQQEGGPRASGKCFLGWGPRGPQLQEETEARGQSRSSFTAQQNRAPLTWQTHLQSAP